MSNTSKRIVAAGISRESGGGIAQGCCRRCGSCCRSLIVEAYARDLRREPRLLGKSLSPYRPDPSDKDWRRGLKCLMLAGPGKACGFLTADDLCSIYATRPDVCRRFEPSPENCSRCLDGDTQDRKGS